MPTTVQVPETHPEVWERRPWTAPEQRAAVSSPTRRRKVATPMPLQTKVIPLFHKKAGDPNSGRITAESLLMCLTARKVLVDEWKIRKMVAEADVNDVGLSPAAVRSCIEGVHKHREYGAGDWLQLVGMVIGCSVTELLQRMNAASKGPRLPISNPGKSFEAEEEVETVYSKSSPKHPCNANGPWKVWNVEEVDAEPAPGPWSSLLRNSLATQTEHTRPSSTRVVPPARATPLHQANVHTGNSKGFIQGSTCDPRLTQSARSSRSHTTTLPPFASSAHRPSHSGPRRKHFISMAGVPPVAYVPKGWATQTLPTEEAERQRAALWAGGTESLTNKEGPSSSRRFYRSVRVVNEVNTSVLRPSTGVAMSRSALRSSEKQRQRPSTAIAPHTSSVHPGTVVDTLRVSGRLNAAGMIGGGDVRPSGPQRNVAYPQPSSALKQLRHNLTKPDVPFVLGVRPLKPGATFQRDFQLGLGGHDIRNTLPAQYWAS
eukprot:CAMPEP_0177762546 /NCGR_PEP_ID=MMETSP0491_2-20121128/6404_1 /TAXON_ID=63592 /ORGANISM="Tetraselmis chuii, Strain PLY429" /LENGTH=486 /DNA_ID=CAMNT_0019278611 /DNA_START=395 /DNA_END=1855 /DNA_ORIENTATION=-